MCVCTKTHFTRICFEVDKTIHLFYIITKLSLKFTAAFFHTERNTNKITKVTIFPHTLSPYKKSVKVTKSSTGD